MNLIKYNTNTNMEKPYSNLTYFSKKWFFLISLILFCDISCDYFEKLIKLM